LRDKAIVTPHYVTVWDPLVRIFHWGVAMLFLLNYWLWEGGGIVHKWAGYIIAAFLVVRFIWGYCGSDNARFRNFWPTRARFRRHFRQLQRREFDATEGHNPLGALMILFLLPLLALAAITGWMQGLDIFWGEDWVQNLHKYAATTLMIAVVIHIGAVLAMSRITGLSLVRTMISGKRRTTSCVDTTFP